MCTFNLTLSDKIMEQLKVAFPSQEDVEEFAQQQLESIFLNIISQRKNYQEKDSKVKSFNQLSSDIQQLLNITSPLKGIVPEWDINGDIYRSEALKEIYGN